jgi:arginine decarboxylase-like protein
MSRHANSMAKKHKKSKKNGFRKFWHLGQEEVNTGQFDITPEGTLLVREGNYQYNIYDIIKKYGTSTEIFFPTIIENRVRDLIETFNAFIKITGYKGKFYYHYPMKVNQNKEFVLPAVAEGANLEVASANELFLVKRMIEQERFNNKIRVVCNGPKTERYISLIEELRGKGLTVIPIIEDKGELDRLAKFKGPVGIRVDLNVPVKSHWDKKFNQFGFTEEEVVELGKVRNLSILHYHISSQVEHMTSLVQLVKRAVEIYAKMREKNPGLDTINIGGGAGVPYDKKKRFYTAKSLISQIVKVAKKQSDKLGVRHPNLIAEWGRYVAAPSQITIYKVISEKHAHNKGGNSWYVIDGSFMNDLLDTWALKQKWHITPVNHLNAKKMQRVWLAGSSCDSDDKYTDGGGYILLPRMADVDELYIAVYDTGAYQDALASHHCLLSSPLKLIAQNGEIKVARKRETPEEVGKQFGW